MAPGRDQFLRGFVRECGDVVDVLTYHLYPTDGLGDEAQALETADDADETITRYRDLWADPQRNPKGFRRKIKFGVSEYGLSSNSQNPRHLADFPAAMWAAEVALRLNQHGVDLAHYFAFQGTAHHGLIDRAGVPRPTYYAYRILSTLRDGWLVAARSSDPGLWVHAAQHGELLTVILINRTRSGQDGVHRAAQAALHGRRVLRRKDRGRRARHRPLQVRRRERGGAGVFVCAAELPAAAAQIAGKSASTARWPHPAAPTIRSTPSTCPS